MNDPGRVTNLLPLPARTVVDRRPDLPGLSDDLFLAVANRPFTLDPTQVCLVEDGEVDLFALRETTRAAAGGRQPLLRVGARRLFMHFAADRPQSLLLASSPSGARISRASRALLDERLRDPATARVTRLLLKGWIEDLCRLLSRERTPARCLPLASAQEIELDGRTPVRPRQGVSWIWQQSGRSYLVGRPELAVRSGGFLALTSHAWLEAEAGTRLQVLRAEDLPDPDALLEGLLQLNRLAGTYCDLLLRDRQHAEVRRVQRASLAPREALDRACRQIAASGASDTAYARAADLLEPPGGPGQQGRLATACRLIAASLGVAVNLGTEGEAAANLQDRLDQILRDCGLRTRKVLLRGDWWNQDKGPLLAFTSDGEQPLVLLWRKGRYQRHDPAAAAPAPFDRAQAGSLAPFAHTFYAPLPDRPLGLRDIFRFAARGSGHDAVWVAAMALAATLLGLVPAIATGLLFNAVIPGAHRPQLHQMTAILVVCALTATTFELLRGVGLLRIQQRMTTTLQAALWDRLLRLPLSFFRPYAAGDLAARAMSIGAIQQVLSGTTATAVLGGLFSLVNVAMMFHYSAPLAWRGLLLIGIALAVTVVGTLLQLSPRRQAVRLAGRTSGLVLQLIANLGKLRVAGAEGRAFSQWAASFSGQRRLTLRTERISGWLASFSAAFPTLAGALLFWTAFPLMASRESPLGPGHFLAFGAAFTACLSSLLGMARAAADALAVIPLYQEARPILQAQLESGQGRSNPGTLSGAIKVQHAVFRYQVDGPPVLRDLSFEVRPGEFVALVGPSGSGKSTLLRLLLGFERAESGGVYFDGQELSSLSLHALRRQLGVVLQSSQLTAGDIFSNIRGSSDCTLEEAMEAAALVGMAEDIQAMPMGMHTIVSDGADTFSGGQRQRLMIARAIVKRPSILLLDEATSALDNRSQATVIQSLERLNVTRIVVAHRLSTIAKADRIHVLEAGRIVESGTFAELIARGGLFAELARRQLT